MMVMGLDMNVDRDAPGHLESAVVAAYLDGTLPPSDRVRVEAHALQCDECRHELIEVARLLRTRPRRGRWYLPVGLAAAAAVLALVVLWPRPAQDVESPEYREPAVTTTVAPSVVAPRGVIDAARMLVWTGVPHADRYRLTLFDREGRLVWETQTSDTTALVPDSIRFQPGASYLWKVEAQTSWNRWVSSELVEFSIGRPRP